MSCVQVYNAELFWVLEVGLFDVHVTKGLLCGAKTTRTFLGEAMAKHELWEPWEGPHWSSCLWLKIIMTAGWLTCTVCIFLNALWGFSVALVQIGLSAQCDLGDDCFFLLSLSLWFITIHLTDCAQHGSREWFVICQQGTLEHVESVIITQSMIYFIVRIVVCIMVAVIDNVHS